MRIVIIAPGSRGDIQPYLALGVGLERAGHSVRVVTTIDHEALVRGFALEVALAPFNVQQALQAKNVASTIEGGGLATSFRQLSQIAARASRVVAEVSLEACRDADAVVTGFGGLAIADGITRKAGIPLVQAYNVPLTPTAAFPGVLVPGLDFGPRSRRLGHQLSRLAIWLTGKASGASALPSPLFSSSPGLVPGPVLYGYSPAFLPVGPEWGADVEVTGFWFAEEPTDFVPPPALVQFLEAGPRPICIGFGSMSQTDPRATTALVLEAVKAAGVRAVLLAGWGGLTAKELPADVLALDGVPHAWLYPRCRAVVHHGGAGTTGAALRAGVPAVVVPFHGDQPFWARRVHASGTGPQPIPRRALTSTRLATALREVCENPAFAAKAAELGATVRGEDGVGRAVEAITRLCT